MRTLWRCGARQICGTCFKVLTSLFSLLVMIQKILFPKIEPLNVHLLNTGLLKTRASYRSKNFLKIDLKQTVFLKSHATDRHAERGKTEHTFFLTKALGMIHPRPALGLRGWPREARGEMVDKRVGKERVGFLQPHQEKTRRKTLPPHP